MKIRVFFLFGWFFLISVMTSSSAFAQTDDTNQLIDSSKAKVLKPIPIENLIENVQVANQELKDTRRKITTSEEVVALDTLFPKAVKLVKSQKKLTEKFIKINPNRQKINNEIKKWNGFRDRLSLWESQVNSDQERNIKLLERILIDEQIWKLTYDKVRDQDIPKEVLGQVNTTYRSIKSLNEEIVDQNNDYLILESRINKEKAGIDEIIGQLEKLKASEVYDLFYRRHEPFWQSDLDGLVKKSDRSETGTEFQTNLKETGKYFQDNSGDILRYLIFVAFFILLVRWLRRVYEKYEFQSTDKNLNYAYDVIVKHGEGVVLFLSILGFLFYTDNRPTLLTDILHLSILFVSVPLIRPFMRDDFKNLLYLVILVYVLDTAKTYIWFSSLQYRAYLMFEAGLIIVLLYKYAFKKISMLKFGEYHFTSILIRLAPLLQIVALVSIVSNLLGYTNLTDLTLDISAKSGVYAFISYALLMVLGSISTGIIHNHFESRNLTDPIQKTTIQRKALVFFRTVAFIFWIVVFLKFIDLLPYVTVYLEDQLTEPYSFGSLTITLGDILNFLLILTLSFVVTSFISFLFDSGQFHFKLLKLPKGIPAAISLVIRYFIMAAGIILALSSLGIDLSKFNLMAGALGLGIGFGLQNVISNFVSGLILVFERPILVGDTVEVNNLMGTVKRIGVRSSNISTFDGAEVVVPNSNLISNNLINWTLSNNIRRVEILLGVAYGSDPNQVLEVLLEVVKENEDILKDPEPQALFSEFGESSLNFRLLFWVPFALGLRAKSAVSIAVFNKLKENGIEIPFPQRDIHIKTSPEQQGE